MWREVTYLPSLPKNGELLMVKSIDIVGSSILIGGSGSGFSKSHIVSPISKPSIPTKAHISPHSTFSTLLLPSPSKTISSLILLLIFVTPSRFASVTFCPARSSPRVSLPTAIRPTYGEYSNDVMSICGVPSATSGAGISSMMASSRGAIESVGSFQMCDIQPCFAEPYIVL